MNKCIILHNMMVEYRYPPMHFTRLLQDLIAPGWRLSGRSEETETDWQLDAKLDAQLDADLDAQRAKESDSDSEDLDAQRAEEPKV
ncbi:hypothetical protein PTTG_02816 [Puccinia triticina 1-1 BBBD Race 1]|uniref:Uncharacterized protein n=1 Tax=Puccinia triticina (isolate 1-1 / race 1 (BBBD)) TaxID=630390 RepID=A0A180GK86_PUCT1|nr:hypothetical protein PTTG_02816 [Puccinia triticina 1-1 BBBD Race 1]